MKRNMLRRPDISAANPTPPPSTSEGHINRFTEWGPATDVYVGNDANHAFLASHVDRAQLYGGAPDLGWFTTAFYYSDIAAVYYGTADAANHPEWILKDAGNNLLYVPYACNLSPGPHCTQYAADHGLAAWRTAFKSQRVQTGVNLGMIGARLDDVNQQGVNTGNGTGAHVDPIDPRTGATMTYTNWKRYLAEQLEDIRASYQALEIMSNMPWFAGNSGSTRGYNDQYIQRTIVASTFMEFERGINDGGIVGGTGAFSWTAMFELCDAIHNLDRNVIWHTYQFDHGSVEYQLAVYFLVSDGGDYCGGSMVDSNPATYWSAFDIDLGSALGSRYTWNGLQRRDFTGGFVLANMPGGSTVTNLSLGGSYRNTSNNLVSTVTLNPASGNALANPPSAAVLRNP